MSFVRLAGDSSGIYKIERVYRREAGSLVVVTCRYGTDDELLFSVREFSADLTQWRYLATDLFAASDWQDEGQGQGRPWLDLDKHSLAAQVLNVIKAAGTQAPAA